MANHCAAATVHCAAWNRNNDAAVTAARAGTRTTSTGLVWFKNIIGLFEAGQVSTILEGQP